MNKNEITQAGLVSIVFLIVSLAVDARFPEFPSIINVLISGTMAFIVSMIHEFFTWNK